MSKICLHRFKIVFSQEGKKGRKDVKKEKVK
jgi:hypothetical protein